MACRATLTLSLVGALLGCSPAKAPFSEFVLLDGSRKTTLDFRGQVTLVNFWATSCGPCVAEMPSLAATHAKYAARGFDTVAVAMHYDRPAHVVNFAHTRQLPFKVAIDSNGAIAKAWDDVRLTPTTFLLDKRGAIVKKYVGVPNFAEVHRLIDKLLAK